MNLIVRSSCRFFCPVAATVFFSVLSCASWKKTPWKDEYLKTDDLDDEPTQGLGWNALISQTQDITHSALYPYLTKRPTFTLKISGQKENPRQIVTQNSYFFPATYPEFLNTLDHLKPFFGGFVGLRGDSRIFALESSGAPHKFSDMYPMIIQVLSREYGCFVKKGMTWQDRHLFSCRDKRNIMVWYQPVLGWSRLVFRQFDHFGYEIKVRARVIHRISERQILANPLKPDQVLIKR